MSLPERPLRILHLTAGSDAGGLSRYIHDLAVAMIARGHEVVVAGERGAWHWLFERAVIPWIDLPLKGSAAALWRASRRLRKWSNDHPVNLIHTHYRRPTLVARQVQRKHRPPILYSVHLSDLKLSFPWRMFSDFGDHTQVASAEARRWVIEDARVAPERVTLIPHGVDVSKFPVADQTARLTARGALDVPSDARVAAFVGRLDYPKNVDWLLDVASRAAAVHFLIAGEGPDEPALRSRIARASLGERVHLLGHRDPLEIYHASDCLLLPSFREGFSLVCAEAMCSGIPVLRTRTAGTSELIIENTTGRSTMIEHDAFVSGAVEFLSLGDSELKRMGAAAAAHVRGNFTFERQLEQTLALYRRIATLSGE